MIHDPILRAALADAALARAASGGWRSVTIHDLAETAGRPLTDFVHATPGDAIDCVEERFDRSAAEGLGRLDPTVNVRDRLFDLAMRRFEAMEPHRIAVLSFEGALTGDPVLLAAAHQRGVRTARWLLALAGVEADGVTGAARAQGLAVILNQARTAWRGETSADFAKTMAALDKALRRAEETFGRWGGFDVVRAEPRPSES